jgi:SAM-dependent methyltransferase|tara:strand:- start:6781 stop:8004 length:1224 start_codon:yes stop_codon:yes gene_type:complete
MNCRHCEKTLTHTFLDLGYAPPSNSYLNKDALNKPEIFYPLKVCVCDKCWLVQTKDYIDAEALFSSDYAYTSSTSSSWLAHAKKYSDKMKNELNLNSDSFVIEVASNDGYLLKNFVKAGIPCLGIEPTDSTANFAEKIGIPVLRKFFSETLGQKLATEEKKADLVIGNNVYAHVPDINDFTKGLKAVLKPGGIITLEFPHLMRLIENIQFDTIYHEHFSYLSLYTANKIFKEAGLRILNVEQIDTHGGSLRIYGCHKEDHRKTQKAVKLLLEREKLCGLQKLKTYKDFQLLANRVKNNLLNFLIKQKQNGKKVVGLGAAAKGNTLLNYAGIKSDLLPFIYDGAKTKQDCFMPGSHIPILSTKYLNQEKPDYILILPWNIADEVKEQNAILEKKGVKFMIAVPDLKIL